MSSNGIKSLPGLLMMEMMVFIAGLLLNLYAVKIAVGTRLDINAFSDLRKKAGDAVLKTPDAAGKEDFAGDMKSFFSQEGRNDFRLRPDDGSVSIEAAGADAAFLYRFLCRMEKSWPGLYIEKLEYSSADKNIRAEILFREKRGK